MYDVRPTRIGGMRKNHFMAVSLINGDPFGVCHRCATTSRIEYKEAVKGHASRKATPNADRTGDFSGRASGPRSMNGKIKGRSTGNPVRRAAQYAAVTVVYCGESSRRLDCGLSGDPCL